ILIPQVRKYITTVGEAGSYPVGKPFELRLYANRYKAKEVTCKFFDSANAAAPKDLGKVEPVRTGDQLDIRFAETRQPGVYRFDLPVQSEKEGEVEHKLVAFNVDTEVESDLKRASYSALQVGGEGGSSGGRKEIIADINGQIVDKQKRSDWSESPWYYLGFLIILVIEQALAVHLSFHLKGGEAQLPAQASGRAVAA